MHTYMCIPSLPMNSIKLNIITNNNLLDGLLLLSLKYRFSPLDNTEARQKIDCLAPTMLASVKLLSQFNGHLSWKVTKSDFFKSLKWLKRGLKGLKNIESTVHFRPIFMTIPKMTGNRDEPQIRDAPKIRATTNSYKNA